jgi:hypothetical protein
LASTTSGFAFSTMYFASCAALPAERDALGEIDADLDDLGSGDCEIVPHDIAATDSRLLRARH